MQLYPVGTNFTSNVYTSGFEKTVCVHYAKQLLSQVSKFGVWGANHIPMYVWWINWNQAVAQRMSARNAWELIKNENVIQKWKLMQWLWEIFKIL